MLARKKKVFTQIFLAEYSYSKVWQSKKSRINHPADFKLEQIRLKMGERRKRKLSVHREQPFVNIQDT